MPDKSFFDSNLFLYAFSENDKVKHDIAKQLILQKGVISHQVINEVSNNLLKKFNFTEEQIKQFVSSCFGRYEIAPLPQEALLYASKLREKYNLSYWDSLIISCALLTECSTLYSEDMQNGLKIDNRLSIVDPFNP